MDRAAGSDGSSRGPLQPGCVVEEPWVSGSVCHCGGPLRTGLCCFRSGKSQTGPETQNVVSATVSLDVSETQNFGVSVSVSLDERLRNGERSCCCLPSNRTQTQNKECLLGSQRCADMYGLESPDNEILFGFYDLPDEEMPYIEEGDDFANPVDIPILDMRFIEVYEIPKEQAADGTEKQSMKGNNQCHRSHQPFLTPTLTELQKI
ncbi:hypothetical protein G5714_014430 [Onychostoma macrolepis]|uniref:Uncharacterized protein n=1 Tax=Onychostoma macrolepis TaxID=369639 RepID=A0A7J6CCS2_9TELE|nr:hypothetical protein G5714_014430 [Onychostoma macrolepis]